MLVILLFAYRTYGGRYIIVVDIVIYMRSGFITSLCATSSES